MQFMLLFSRQGKLRLQKWYTAQTDKAKKKTTRELITMVLARKPKMCSFLEWKDLKVVYKRHEITKWILSVVDLRSLTCVCGADVKPTLVIIVNIWILFSHVIFNPPAPINTLIRISLFQIQVCFSSHEPSAQVSFTDPTSSVVIRSIVIVWCYLFTKNTTLYICIQFASHFDQTWYIW